MFHGDADLVAGATADRIVLRGAAEDRKHASGEATRAGPPSQSRRDTASPSSDWMNGFKLGDMVWGKVVSHPWWPGHIYNDAFVNPSVLRARRDGHVLVAFFGDSSYRWFSPSNLLPYEPHFAEKSQQIGAKRFAKAFQESLDESGRRGELSVTCSCRNPQYFRPAGVPGYFCIDMPGYEPDGIYSHDQIQRLREGFMPGDFLSFLRNLAVVVATSPLGKTDARSASWIRGQKMALAYRDAVFKNLDVETYAQAFGVEPVQPSKGTFTADHMAALMQQENFAPRAEPPEGKLAALQSFAGAGADGERKTDSLQPAEEEETYLLKRRKEPISVAVRPPLGVLLHDVHHLHGEYVPPAVGYAAVESPEEKHVPQNGEAELTTEMEVDGSAHITLSRSTMVEPEYSLVEAPKEEESMDDLESMTIAKLLERKNGGGGAAVSKKRRWRKMKKSRDGLPKTSGSTDGPAAISKPVEESDMGKLMVLESLIGDTRVEMDAKSSLPLPPLEEEEEMYLLKRREELHSATSRLFPGELPDAHYIHGDERESLVVDGKESGASSLLPSGEHLDDWPPATAQPIPGELPDVPRLYGECTPVAGYAPVEVPEEKNIQQDGETEPTTEMEVDDGAHMVLSLSTMAEPEDSFVEAWKQEESMEDLDSITIAKLIKGNNEGADDAGKMEMKESGLRLITSTGSMDMEKLMVPESLSLSGGETTLQPAAEEYLFKPREEEPHLVSCGPPPGEFHVHYLHRGSNPPDAGYTPGERLEEMYVPQNQETQPTGEMKVDDNAHIVLSHSTIVETTYSLKAARKPEASMEDMEPIATAKPKKEGDDVTLPPKKRGRMRKTKDLPKAMKKPAEKTGMGKPDEASLAVPAKNLTGADIGLALCLGDLKALAVDSFYGIQCSVPSIVRRVFLKYRSMVFRKSLAPPPPSFASAADPATKPTAQKSLQASEPLKHPRPAMMIGHKHERPPGDTQTEMPRKLARLSMQPAAEDQASKSASLKSLQPPVKQPTMNLTRKPERVSKIKPSSAATEAKSKPHLEPQAQAPPACAATTNKSAAAAAAEESVPERVVSPTWVVISFPQGSPLPSASSLKAKFRKFGPLDPDGTHISWKNFSCRVLFQHKADAVTAVESVRNIHLFGQMKASYSIREVAMPAPGKQEMKKSSPPTQQPPVQLKDPHPPVQLKSILKKPAPDNGGGSVSVGKEIPRVKFMLDPPAMDVANKTRSSTVEVPPTTGNYVSFRETPIVARGMNVRHGELRPGASKAEAVAGGVFSDMSLRPPRTEAGAGGLIPHMNPRSVKSGGVLLDLSTRPRAEAGGGDLVRHMSTRPEEPISGGVMRHKNMTPGAEVGTPMPHKNMRPREVRAEGNAGGLPSMRLGKAMAGGVLPDMNMKPRDSGAMPRMNKRPKSQAEAEAGGVVQHMGSSRAETRADGVLPEMTRAGGQMPRSGEARAVAEGERRLEKREVSRMDGEELKRHMLGLMMRCNDVLVNVKDVLGYIPYRPF